MTTLTPVQTAAVETATRTAREYLRVSKGKGRTARSIRDQHSDNLQTEEEYGPWAWGVPYRDTGSASKYARKDRDDFEKLLTDLRSGAFGKPGDVLVLWEISRLSRETGRGVEIIDLCEAGSYLIHITSHERPPYNPRNYNDRHELISGIADAEKEARRLSARTLRGLNSAAREGRPQGPVQFGYQRDYEVIDGRPRPVAQYPHDVDGRLVAELFARVAGAADNQLGDGNVPLLYSRAAPGDTPMPEAIYSIAKDWEQRGILSRDRVINGELVPGVPFSPQNLRSMLLRPSYAGLRLHRGEIVPVQWEGWTPIVSRALFERVQKILSDPSRRTYTGEHIRHVLSTTLRCDVCGGPLVVMARWKKHRKVALGYQCHLKGHVWIPKEATDRFIIGDLEAGEPGVILAYLARPEVYGPLNADDGDDVELQRVREELRRRRGELAELEAARPGTLAEARAIARATEAAEADVSGLQAREESMTRPNPLPALFPPTGDVLARWQAAPVSRQRAIAALLLTPRMLGEVRVTRSPVRRGAAPVDDRIVWRREPR